jgi:hypothetical protein
MKIPGMLPIAKNKKIYLAIWWWENESIVIRGFDSKTRAIKDVDDLTHQYFDETIYPFDENDKPIPHTEILLFIDKYLKVICEGAKYQIVTLQILR